MAQAVMILMAIFMVVGGVDRIFGSKLGLGIAFENGLKTMGELALSMVGILVLAPVIATAAAPVVSPFFRSIGADPSLFAGVLLACDMGGAPLAAELALREDVGLLSGLVTASMLGAAVSFTIPVAMSGLSGEDRPFAAKGILCGLVTVPLGILAGGLVSGVPILYLLRNTWPVAVVSGLIALGLWKAEKYLIIGFVWFGRLITAVATVGLVVGGLQTVLGITLIPGLGSMGEAFGIVGQIAIVLAGAFPLLALVDRVLKKPLQKAGALLKMNSTSVSGLVATLANSIVTFGMVKEMDRRGKVVNMAFAVSGAFVFGDHLAFAAGYAPQMIPALIAGKLAAGVAAVVLAMLLTRKEGHHGS